MIKARPVAGDIAAGERLPHGTAALRLAQISRLRRHRRHPFDQAPDPRPQGPWRDRRARPQRQARPRRHPRDRVLRPDPATDRRRPPPGTARPRHARDARPAGRARLDHRRGARRAGRGLLVPAPHRARLQMVADEQTQSLPEDDEELRAHRPHAAAMPTRHAFSKAFRAALQAVREPLRRAVRDGAGTVVAASATSSSPATSTIPTRSRRWRSSASSGRATSAAIIRGWHFGRYRATQSAEARERLTELTPALLDGLRHDAATPTRR